jgi:hypothetical protein
MKDFGAKTTIVMIPPMTMSMPMKLISVIASLSSSVVIMQFTSTPTAPRGVTMEAGANPYAARLPSSPQVSIMMPIHLCIHHARQSFNELSCIWALLVCLFCPTEEGGEKPFLYRDRLCGNRPDNANQDLTRTFDGESGWLAAWRCDAIHSGCGSTSSCSYPRCNRQKTVRCVHRTAAVKK